MAVQDDIAQALRTINGALHALGTNDATADRR